MRFSAIFFLLVLAIGCGRGSATKSASSKWDEFFPEQSVPLFESNVFEPTRSLPPDLATTFAVGVNSDERVFVPLSKQKLSPEAVCYYLVTEDEGYQNFWAYTFSPKDGKFLGNPILLAYYYRDDDQIGIRATKWLDRNAFLQREIILYEATSDSTYASSVDTLVMLNWDGQQWALAQEDSSGHFRAIWGDK